MNIDKHHDVENVYVKGGILVLTVDGKNIECDLNQISPPLASAKEHEKITFEITPSGYGIYWPLVDEDISIDGLLGVVHTPQEEHFVHYAA